MLVRKLFRTGNRTACALAAAAAALLLAGCAEIGPGGAEAKIGAGPFKLYGAEIGPGGAEIKGPSAGPFRMFR